MRQTPVELQDPGLEYSRRSQHLHIAPPAGMPLFIGRPCLEGTICVGRPGETCTRCLDPYPMPPLHWSEYALLTTY